MRAKDFLLSSTLLEVKMSPTNLSKLVSKIDATVGIEFEMIIPDVYVRDEDEYPENDMSEDRIPDSISDIIDFFAEGDENDGFALSKLEDKLRFEYDSMLDSIVKEKWQDDGEEYFKKWIRENVPDNEVADKLEILYDDPDSIELTKEQWDEFIKKEWEDETYNYDNAYEEYKERMVDDEEVEESDILNKMGIKWMEDVYNNYDIDWPYKEWMGDDPDYVYSGFADDLSQYVGYNVEYSTSYGSYKPNDAFVIEPDSSITPDDVGAGIEVVSPPLPREEAIIEMENVISWAATQNAYTNHSTGLHINISIPGYSVDKLDYVKLALLTGDKYVLEQFDRIANSYAVSALDKINDFATEADKELFFRALKGNLNNIVGKILHPAATDKYTSINVKNNRIEFRSPGGDWLDKNIGDLVNTINRFIVALDAALDPSKYQEEYLKKLTKAFSPKSGSTEELFIKYTSGALSKEELRTELQNLRNKKNRSKLLDKGVAVITYDQVRNGDWIVEQIDNDKNIVRVFLKRTRTVDTSEKALRIALEIPNISFDTSRIEDIIATEYEGNRTYYIYERGYPFVTRYDIFAMTPITAIERLIDRFGFGEDLDLLAGPRSSVDYRSSNAQLLDRSQQIYAIVSHTSEVTDEVTQCVMSGNSPEHAINRARLWFGTMFDPSTYEVKAYPIEEYTRDNPNNNPHELKIYSVSGSEYLDDKTIVATSRKQAIEVLDRLFGYSVEDLGIILVYEWQKIRHGELESYLERQNSMLDMKSGYTGNYLDVSKGILKEPESSEEDGMQDYLVNNKDANYGGVIIRAASETDAIEEARRRFNILPFQELVAIPQK